MAYTVTPTEQAVYGALASFIRDVTGLPAGSVVQGLANRVAMPLPGFITMQSVNFRRLRTNVRTYAAGADPATVGIEEAREVTVQIDCYGPSSEEWATMLSTLLRDDVGYDALGPTCEPLFADDARQIELTAGEEQYEMRWTLEAHLQVNSEVTAPQQYADTLDLKLIDVDVEFPPS